VKSQNDTVITAYKTKTAELEKTKLLLMEKATNSTKPRATFDSMFEHAVIFPSRPCNIWNSGKIELQRLVLRLAFSERIAYCKMMGIEHLKYPVHSKP